MDTCADERASDEANQEGNAHSNDQVSTLLVDAVCLSFKSELENRSASMSGDEIETTTSSDIEIIASPQAGFRNKMAQHHKTNDQDRLTKTHYREPSEASSEDSTKDAMEIEKMARKISELQQILEVKIGKVLHVFNKCN